MIEKKRKTALFTGINAVGHVNSLLGLADRLKRDYNFNTVFLLFGPPCTGAIEARGHRLIALEDSVVLEDYELLEGEQETGVELKDAERKQRGLKKKKFTGADKIAHLIKRECRPFKQPRLDDGPMPDVFVKLWFDEAIAHEAGYEQVIRELAPDLIVVDAAFTIPAIVTLKHIPWVRLDSVAALYVASARKGLTHAKPSPSHGFTLYTKAERQRLRREEPQRWQAMLDQWNEAARVLKKVNETYMLNGPLAKFLKEKGCPSLDTSVEFPMHESPHLNLYLYPKELDYDQDDDLFEYKARRFRCDSILRLDEGDTDAKIAACWDRELEKAAARFTNKAGSLRSQQIDLVFVSLGTLACSNIKAMKRLIEMLAQDSKKRLYVVSKGADGDLFELAPNMIGANYLPQPLLLRQSQLAIIVGGNNTLAECCHFGVPMIVIPAHGDQFDNAQRVEDLQLGKRLDFFDCDAAKLLQTIDELLANVDLRQRMSRISENMRRRDDASKAAAMLNKLAHEGRLEQTFIDYCRNGNPLELNLK